MPYHLAQAEALGGPTSLGELSRAAKELLCRLNAINNK